VNNELARLRARLERATHGLGAEPRGAPWNIAEIADLLPSAAAFRSAAVLVPLVPRVGGATVLLTRRTDQLTHHAGQISFPGGRIEDGDAGPVAAALRECQEEVGIAPAMVEPIGFLDALVTITGFRVTPVVALVDSAHRLVPDPDEVAEVFEVPFDFLMSPASHERRSREFRGRVRHYDVFPWQGRDIWGATASMLVNFAERWHRAEAAA
jgi:8-oxo-dGTP pyrophosphatase MutT (NUDIX family)